MGGICSDKSRGRGEGDVFQLFSDDFQKTKFVWPTFFVFADFPDDFPDDSPDDFPHDFPLRRMAALPRWSRMPILLHRWEMASPSSCPVCLARAAPSFLTSRSAPVCQPPKVSATRGKKAMPCLQHNSSASFTFWS